MTYEDEYGNEWEGPDDEGRIRVRDLDGNLNTWYDPGDPDYPDAVKRIGLGAAEAELKATLLALRATLAES